MRLGKLWSSAVLASIALFVAFGSPGDVHATGGHGVSPDCRSGRTVFHRGSIRAFVVQRQFKRGRERAPYKTFYVCRPGSRTARVISQGEPYSREKVYGFKVFGDRLGFVVHSEGVQSGSETEVGWIDLRIGRVRTGVINASEGLMNEAEEERGLPRVPDQQVKYAIAGDGTVAVLGQGGYPVEWEVCLLPLTLHSLGPPLKLFEAMSGQEGLDPNSLAITDTSVTWRTKNGQAASVQR
jgi:hypothetical protein